jgi:Asp-tRNA(Asn)/Glu-tRNA(Gln) amidotransferase B subunit
MQIPQDRLALTAALRAKRDAEISSDESMMIRAIDTVLASKPKALADYRVGKPAALHQLIGLVKKLEPDLDGKAIMAKVQERLKDVQVG